MDTLKKIFPIAFMEKKDLATLIISLLIQVVVGVVIGVVFGVLVWIPFAGILFALIGSLVDIYILANIILTCFDYFKILN